MKRRMGRMYMRGWWEECGWGMSSCVVDRRKVYWVGSESKGCWAVVWCVGGV